MEIALNVHGTRVVQKMIECHDSSKQADCISAAIHPRVIELIQDMNGNHVVQRCLASLPRDRTAFIFECVIAECLAVSCQRHGCCVLQRCLDHADEIHRRRIINQARDWTHPASNSSTALAPLLAQPLYSSQYTSL